MALAIHPSTRPCRGSVGAARATCARLWAPGQTGPTPGAAATHGRPPAQRRQAPGSARPAGPPPPAGIATGAHRARSTPPGLRRLHPDRPAHRAGPMAASAPDNPPAGSACPWARHRMAHRPRLCANLRKVGPMLLSRAQPRRPSGGPAAATLGANHLPWATTRPYAPRRPYGGSCLPCRTAPGSPILASRLPCMFFGRRPPGPIAHTRA